MSGDTWTRGMAQNLEKARAKGLPGASNPSSETGNNRARAEKSADRRNERDLRCFCQQRKSRYLLIQSCCVFFKIRRGSGACTGDSALCCSDTHSSRGAAAAAEHSCDFITAVAIVRYSPERRRACVSRHQRCRHREHIFWPLMHGPPGSQG